MAETQVLETGELLDLILLNLEIRDLVLARGVSTRWKHTIDRTAVFKPLLFREARPKYAWLGFERTSDSSSWVWPGDLTQAKAFSFKPDGHDRPDPSTHLQYIIGHVHPAISLRRESRKDSLGRSWWLPSNLLTMDSSVLSTMFITQPPCKRMTICLEGLSLPTTVRSGLSVTKDVFSSNGITFKHVLQHTRKLIKETANDGDTVDARQLRGYISMLAFLEDTPKIHEEELVAHICSKPGHPPKYACCWVEAPASAATN